MTTAFRLRSVTVDFGGGVGLRDIDLDIEPGEQVALVGSSGAGKTTLLRLLNGAQRPHRGSVSVGDADLDGLRPRELRRLRSQLGHLPQELGLVPNQSVAFNVQCGRLGQQGVLRGLRSAYFPRRHELEEVLALLDRLGIGDKLFARVDSLSGGERQRAAIARALYQRPSALLVDEPLSALDPERASSTLELLVELATERRLTLVLSLHDIYLARQWVPRLVGLRAGSLVFDRPGREVGPADLEPLYRLPATGRVEAT